VLEAAFKLLGQGEGDSAFWLSLAVVRCQNALGVLNHVTGHYSLRGLYWFVFDDHFRKSALATANDTLLELQVQAADGDVQAALDMRRLKRALDYETTVAPGYTDTPTRSAAASTAPSRPHWRASRIPNSKTPSAPRNTARPTSTTSSMAPSSSSMFRANSSKLPHASSTCFSKSASSKPLNERAQMAPGPRKERPVLFLCDQYQQICSAGDAAFFAPATYTPEQLDALDELTAAWVEDHQAQAKADPKGSRTRHS
jgi:hypothetical protein